MIAWVAWAGMLAPPMTLPAADCGAAGERAVERRDWRAAIEHYRDAARDERCGDLRPVYLHNAAILALRLGRLGTAAERCSAATYFEQVLAARPAPALEEAARRGLAEALADCPPERTPWQPTRVVILADAGQPAAPDTPTVAELAHVPLSSSPPSLVYPPAAGVEGHAGWVLVSSAGVALAGGVASYFWLRSARDTRDDAVRVAEAFDDPAVWQTQRQRYDEADDSAVRASSLMYALFAVGAGLGVWGVVELASDDDDEAWVLSTPGVRSGGSRASMASMADGVMAGSSGR